MTISIGKRGNETHRNEARIGVNTPETARGRGRGIVISTFLASAAAAVMILALAPTSFAVAPGFSGEPGPHTPTPTKTADATRTTSTSSPAPTMPGDMPGMDHGSGNAPESSPSPTMAGDMPGMDHGSAEVPGKAHDEATPGKKHDDGAPGSPWKTPEHEHAEKVEVVPDQPLAAVLGTFGVGSGAVMVSAGVLRHRDRARNRIKAAARAARRSQS